MTSTSLKFSFGNRKLQRGEVIFDLPAGHTYPFAHRCKAQAHRITGRIIDHNDSHAWESHQDFAVLIHGIQPKKEKL